MQENMMGHNIIITEPSSNLRALGRNALAGKWKVAILAYLIYCLCLNVPTSIFNKLFGVGVTDASDAYMYGSSIISTDLYNQLYNSSPTYSFISLFYIILITGAFTLGLTIFFLALFRKQHVVVTDIFLGFERFGKSLGLLMFQMLFIILWSLIGMAVILLGCVVMAFTFTGGILLVIIGMIVSMIFATIAEIKYSQSFYILADDPEKGIRQCVDESKIMMKGNKSKYFWMTISFIGWYILSCIPMGILMGVAQTMQVPGVIFVIMEVVSSLFIVPISVYVFSTQAGFYEILAGHLIKETEPAPINSETVQTIEAPPAEPENTVTVSEDAGESSESEASVAVDESSGRINTKELLENNNENNDKEV